MNFIQKNPSDPQYEEFHNGEYEYWPLDDAVKTKSISIPAAVVSGLELLAAAAVAGLLAAALAVLYVISSPLALTESSAAINANVYNNSEDQSIVYTLSTKADPDSILQDGILEDDESTLFLKNLASGTTYLLRYYNEAQAEIGDFQFTTPGGSGTSQPSDMPDVPEDPEGSDDIVPTPTETEDPVDETVAETTQETTEPTTESTTEPTTPVYYPPTPGPPSRPDDTPTKPTEPEFEPIEPDGPTIPTNPTTPTNPTDPTRPTDPTEPSEPEIIVVEPDMGEVKHQLPEVSGDEVEVYFRFEEYHTFLNVPESGYTVKIEQGGTEISAYESEWSEEDGALRISFMGNPIPNGKATTTTVTVTTDSGASYTSTNTVFPPALGDVDLTVEKNEDGTHTFTAVADVISDGTQEIVCEATIFTTRTDDMGVELPMTEDSANRYTASHRATISSRENPEMAHVVIIAYWARTNPDEYTQYDYYYCEYTP